MRSYLVQFGLKNRVEIGGATDGDQAVGVGQFGENADLVVVFEMGTNYGHCRALFRWKLTKNNVKKYYTMLPTSYEQLYISRLPWLSFGDCSVKTWTRQKELGLGLLNMNFNRKYYRSNWYVRPNLEG